MSGALVTVANPAALGAVPELRAELARINGHVVALAAHVHCLSSLTTRLNARLVVLVNLHQLGDDEALRAALEDLTAQYLGQLRNPEAKH